MSNIKTLQKILEEIQKDYEPLTSFESHKQAAANVFLIEIEENKKNIIIKSDLSEFFNSIKSIISKKVKEASTLYFWIDGYACQIRFSLIKKGDPSTCFKSKIQLVAPEIIINAYLQEEIQTGLDSENGLWVFATNIEPEEFKL